MRRKDKQVTDLKTLHSVINKAQVCRIAMVKGDTPYLIPLSFGFDGESIYFHSANSGEKVEILKHNNQVCIEFEQDIRIIEHEIPCDWSAQYLTVIVHGTAEVVAEPIDKSYGLNQIVAHYQGRESQVVFAEADLKSVLVYKVTPKEIIGKVSGIKL